MTKEIFQHNKNLYQSEERARKCIVKMLLHFETFINWRIERRV